ncbi:Putative SAM-dependent methyltransferase [Evansella caseinilytica]|uniref:Putative SAM-dependent methyltransferase n=1 Tax=Evansella caseinilytica TaxID=1503961 RepID=A0A1H3LXP1_9BACI|nr:class I SAM-dependent methyltransferase [Evansella caseinilytica]SDY68778.1 Putative SAM-dependent methyltransferase [Evansella caseinilytica]
MTEFIVTTSTRPNGKIIKEAMTTAEELSVPYVRREKRSAASIMAQYNAGIMIIGKDSFVVHAVPHSPPFFFHPNAAMLRAKRWLTAKRDAMIDACQLERGDRFLDGTLGLASDAILASLAVGSEGKVIGVEMSPILAYVVKKGLQFYHSNVETIDGAMRRIQVMNMSHISWLGEAPSKSVDVVYFDPMFQEAIQGSDGFDIMRPLTRNVPITSETIREASRVARKRVVMKDHFRSRRFQELGFQVQIRPSATYHFGTIEM